MCTNRLSALDPAVRRRAADVLSFARPGDEQRRFVLSIRLETIGLGRHHIEALVAATGPQRGGRDYGFTFSDLTQRLLPTIVLDAYPTQAGRRRARGRDRPSPWFRRLPSGTRDAEATAPCPRP